MAGILNLDFRYHDISIRAAQPQVTSGIDVYEVRAVKEDGWKRSRTPITRQPDDKAVVEVSDQAYDAVTK
jgi:hypothetical protein